MEDGYLNYLFSQIDNAYSDLSFFNLNDQTKKDKYSIIKPRRVNLIHMLGF